MKQVIGLANVQEEISCSAKFELQHISVMSSHIDDIIKSFTGNILLSLICECTSVGTVNILVKMSTKL